MFSNPASPFLAGDPSAQNEDLPSANDYGQQLSNQSSHVYLPKIKSRSVLGQYSSSRLGERPPPELSALAPEEAVSLSAQESFIHDSVVFQKRLGQINQKLDGEEETPALVSRDRSRTNRNGVSELQMKKRNSMEIIKTPGISVGERKRNSLAVPKQGPASNKNI